MTLVAVKSILTGKQAVMEVSATVVELQSWLRDGTLPDIPEDEKSFLTTGLTPKDWDEAFT